ncbi:MAG: serine/threonine-protein kinase [Sandaracinus sp.]
MPTDDEQRRRAEAVIEALARTLPLGALASADPGATLRPAEIPRTAGPATTRKAERTATSDETLPRLEVRMADGEGAADLELVETIGEGGMGVVWLARQRTLGREVAVKRLRDEERSEALLREARATGALEHPSVVPVHALGADESGAPLLVMKRIEGDSLDALVRDPQHAAWPALERRYGDRTSAIVEILSRVADALHFAHARGIVHRDVKPANVMVGAFGEVYLVDWGIALRLREPREPTNDILGTPAFMAPEMARSEIESIDERTDVYLLGATLHAALTGRSRHVGTTLPNVILAALASAPQAYPDELAELGAIANRATHLEKSERFASAAAFREALAGYLRHRTALRLVREAETKVRALEGGAERLSSPAAFRTLTESRFALTEALRAFPESVEAREALDRTLRVMIERELAHRSPEAAEALATELAKRDEALGARIEALRAEVAEARALEERARRDEAERDPRRTARQRAWIAGAMIVLTVVLVAMGLRSEAAHAGSRSMDEVMTYDAVLNGAVVLLLVVFRKLFLNRIGRQVGRVLMMVVVGQAVSDAIFWWREADPREAGASALLVTASVLGGAGVGIDARFFVPAGAFLVGAIVCGLFPTLTIAAIGGAAIVGMGTVLVDALVDLRRG